MKAFFKELANLLVAGDEVVLAELVGHAGSTPRSSGAMMAVLQDGTIRGSVGGGLLEAKVMKLAPALFELGGAIIKELRLSGPEAASLGMACGGDVTAFALRVPASTEEAALYKTLAEELEAGRECLLATDMEGPEESLRVVSRRLLSRDESAKETPKPLRAPRLARQGQRLRLLEPFAPPYAVHIAGAGHVGYFTARLAAEVGFRVIVIDDREEFANAERFPGAATNLCEPSFEDVFSKDLGPRDFAVIATRGHLFDKTVLARALSSNAGYVGMIGSKKKRAAVYAELLREGFSQADLDRVHCPIGLAIGAETPEEIAVSIVAELIKARADAATKDET